MALTQSHYRFGTEDGTESTHGWLAAEDKPVMLPPGRPFLLRIGVQADGTAHNNTAFTWQYQINGGGWNNITTASSVVRTGATAVFANGANCTKRLSGTGTFEASGAGCTHDGTSGGPANDIVANGNSETLIGLQLLAGSTAVGDLVEFRVVNGAGVPLAGYAAVPSVRVGAEILPVQSRAAEVHTSLSAGVTKISGTEVRVRCVGLSAADLADSTLTMTMNVWGTTVVGSTDPADYTVHLQGPAGWVGGLIGKAGTELAGMAIPPGFAFAQDIPEGVRRVLATFEPSRTVTFGADATTIEAV